MRAAPRQYGGPRIAEAVKPVANENASATNSDVLIGNRITCHATWIWILDWNYSLLLPYLITNAHMTFFHRLAQALGDVFRNLAHTLSFFPGN